MRDISGGATDLKLHVSDQQINAVLGYVSPDNNVLNEYQEYFEYVIIRLQLENPSNYQHGLQLFGVLKDAALNGILMTLYTCNEHRHHFFFLDHITKLVHVNPFRHGGGEDTLCLRQIFLFVVGASGILRKLLTKS